MNRRRYLVVAAIPLSAGVAGCLGEDGGSNPEGSGGDAEDRARAETGTRTGGETGTAPRSETGEASGSASDVRIVVRSPAPERATVRLAVSADGDVFFEEVVDVPPGGGRSVDPGVDETGRYELEVAVEGGPDGSYPFSVEEYDLEMGSNVIVAIDDDDVGIMIEE